MRTPAPFRAALLTSDPDAHAMVAPFLATDPDLVLVNRDGADLRECVYREGLDLAIVDAEDDVFALLQQNERAVNGSAAASPQSIFVARTDRLAARAFEVGAVDYLLAPLAPERLRTALERFKQRMRAERVDHLNRQLSAMLGQLHGDRSPSPSRHTAYLDRIPIKEHDLVRFIPTSDVAWIEAAGNYVLLHVGGKGHLLLETMRGIEARLDPTRFLRIHRSRIVNLDYVEALSALPYGEYEVHLRGGQTITSSRSRSADLSSALGL